MNMTLEERIGKAFSDSLRDVLTNDEWNRMKRANTLAARLPNVCHSHDYVDANEYMYSAIQAETSTTWFDAQTNGEYTEEFCELWNNSWKIAQDRWLSCSSSLKVG